MPRASPGGTAVVWDASGRWCATGFTELGGSQQLGVTRLGGEVSLGLSNAPTVRSHLPRVPASSTLWSATGVRLPMGFVHG